MFNRRSRFQQRLLFIASSCVFSVTPSIATVSEPAFDVSNYQCSFALEDGHQSVRRLTFNAQAYQCLQGANYQDIAVVNGAGKLVPFQRVKGGDIKVEKTSKKYKFYSEDSAPEVKTADQVRRISQLTGLQAGSETNQQWQLKNSFYSSFIVPTLDAQGKRVQLGQLDTLHLEINTASKQAVNAVVMVEHSDDLQNWRTLVNRYDAYLLPSSASLDDEKSRQTMTLSVPITRYNSSASNKYLRIAVLSNVTDFSSLLSEVNADYHKTQMLLPKQQWLRLKVEKVEPSPEHPNKSNDSIWLANTGSLARVNKLRFIPPQETALYQGRVRSKRHQSAFSGEPVKVDGRKKVKSILRDVAVGKSKKRIDKSWRQTVEFSFYQLQTQNGQVSNMLKGLSERQSHDWEFHFSSPESMTVDQLPIIELGWRPSQFDFVAQGLGPYRLLVGGRVATNKINYPIQLSQLAGSAEDVSLLVMKKQEIEVQGVVKSEEKVSATLPWDKIILWGLLALGVLLMLSMVRQLSKKLNTESD